MQEQKEISPSNYRHEALLDSLTIRQWYKGQALASIQWRAIPTEEEIEKIINAINTIADEIIKDEDRS